MYIPLDEYDQFLSLRDFSRDKVAVKLISIVRQFHESEDLEELILNALYDPNRTPHGPAEIADILTLQLSHRNNLGVAAFILKGKSFSTVRPSDISHQVFRLRKISDIKYAVLGHVGNLLDEAREEFIHTAENLKINYSIIDAVEFARLAVVEGIICPRDGNRLRDGQCDCGYRTKGDHLNFLQKDALTNLKNIHELGQESGLVVMPTGSGKTRIAAVDSYNFSAERILYIAHTHEILEGAEREFAHVYGINSIHRGFFYDNSLPTPSVHLSTIQSISRNLDIINPLAFDYVVIDEFHHAAATSYRKLIDKIRPKFLLGLTATPFRGDRQDVLDLCNGNIIVEHELRTGIDGRILVPYHYYGCFDNVDYSKLTAYSYGYSVRDLNKTLIIPERDEAVIKKWSELAEKLPTLAFCCSEIHAKRMAKSFKTAGINAAEYLGKTPMDLRIKLVEKLRYGDLKILCVVDVLNEGVDIPFVECLLFLRPTESKRIFFQQLGRGLRKSPGKEKVIVLDFIGNFHNAYKIVDYIGLLPEEHSSYVNPIRSRSSREVLNLPLGCEVYFDDKVIDIFATQIHDPRRASRHNIAQILIFEYYKTSRRLGYPASKKEIDRIQLLDSDFYKLVFGSWKNFEQLMVADEVIKKLKMPVEEKQ